MPQQLAGMRIEPPPSLPNASGPSLDAIAAAAPPLDPPHVFDRSQGLRVPEYGSVRQRLVPKFRRGGLTEENRTCLLKSRHRHRVLARYKILEDRGSHRGPHARRKGEILHRKRHSMQWSEIVAAHHGFLRLLRLCASGIMQNRDEGVDRCL